MLGAMLKSAPKKVANLIDRQQRRRVFESALQRFMDLPSGREAPTSLLQELVYGWNNPWSAQVEYIAAFLKAALHTPGPILECGSGLSTLLLGAVAQRKGSRVWCLEHEQGWAAKLQQSLDRFAIRAVTICPVEIVSHGWYSWYAPPLESMPCDFALVICDGPPGSTPGGRYGLLPVMGSHCRSGCEILLDDADRPSERAILERWAHELDVDCSVSGNGKQFGRLLMP